MGQNAGCPGLAFDPFDDSLRTFQLMASPTCAVTSVMAEVDEHQLAVAGCSPDHAWPVAPALEETAATRYQDGFARRAFELLASPASRNAFNLAGEPQPIRDAYGANPYGESCLLARRLVEAGAPLDNVHLAGNRDWDTHGMSFQSAQEYPAAADRSCRVHAAHRPGEPRPARRNPGRLDGRHGPHAADQRRRGPRSLVLLLLYPDGRRWRSRRPGVRLV